MLEGLEDRRMLAGWPAQAGGTDYDEGGTSALPDGSAIVTGGFGSTATFGATTLTSSGGYDVYVAKMNANGTFAWAVNAGGAGYDSGSDISVLTDGSALVSGSFRGTATFGATTLTSSGFDDVFVAKVNASGTFAWVMKAGGTGDEAVYGSSISALPDGSAILTGSFIGSATFGATTLTSSGDADVFVAKVNANGTFAWAVNAGGPLYDWDYRLPKNFGYGISTLTDGAALVTGSFRGTATCGATTLTSSGFDDVFVAKVNPDGLFAQASSKAVDSVDLNGDGIVDVIWERDGGPSVGWIYDAAGSVVQTRALGGDATWSIETVGDFDGNGVTDLVWRNATSGVEVLRLMQASGAVLSATLLGGDATWRIESSGDYDGDGRTDLVWRNAAGITYLWRMSGPVVLSTRILGGDTNWQIVGTGDFNGDGRHDVLWRDCSGTVVQWLMNDGVALQMTRIAVGSDRAPVSTADINGDAKTDILWRNASTGATTVWLMNGAAVAATRDIGGNAVWRILRRPGRRPF